MLSNPLLKTTADGLVALAIGTAGGALFYILHTPLPWTLGSLVATAILAMLGHRRFLPRFAWNVARPFVGILAGSAFTLPVVMAMAGWWDVLLALLAYSIASTFVGYLFFRRIGKYDEVSAFFASAPGGLGELTLLGGTLGGNVRTLVLTHAIRIVVVVFTVPFFVQFFLAPVVAPALPTGAVEPPQAEVLDYLILTACGAIGFFLGKPFGKIGGVMVVPMLLSAVVHIAGWSEVVPPSTLIAFMQIVIGSMSGSRFAGTTVRELRTSSSLALIWALVLTAGATAAAALCSTFASQPLTTLVLAFAPGGIVEITIVAYAMGVQVAFVVTCQLFRLVMVLSLTPVTFRLFRKFTRK